MSQRILDVRVRPARVAIVINRQASINELLLAFEFCSRIWGGRFTQILPVDAAECDDLTAFRLAQSRPDYVYSIGLEDNPWASAVAKSCQPRGYGSLNPEFVRGLHGPHFEEYILVDHALADSLRINEPRQRRRRLLAIVSADGTPWDGCCAALFGLHYKELKPEHFDESYRLGAGSPVHGYVELATRFATQGLRSWLDLTGYKLNLDVTWGEEMAAQIVLVKSPVEDLSLFWNLRTASQATWPAPIIPLPLQDAADEKVLHLLKDWVLSLAQYGVRSNYCLVTSETLDESVCCEFATRLGQCLAGTSTPHADYLPPRRRLPVVVPYDSTFVWSAQLNRRKLSFLPPSPKAFGVLGTSRTWFIDLLKDTQTGRAVKELELPSSPAIVDVLNGPCPPTITIHRLPSVAAGIDSISISCSVKREFIKIHLPSAAEVLTEVLMEHGVEPMEDEKRSAYLPVIKRLGGVQQAARTFSGVSRNILKSLGGGTRTVAQLLGDCRLGKGTLPDDGYLNGLMSFLNGASDRSKRIVARRFAEYTSGKRPRRLTLTDLLEMWANDGIVLREWKIGPCPHCLRTYFEPRLNIQRHLTCPGCGNRITLPARVDVGYGLHRAVRAAIAEGVIPVVLTGRFLNRMTSRGFLWLPGFKYQHGNAKGDIDVVACCDGKLVFCECKDLDGMEPQDVNWAEIVGQYSSTVELALRCNADLIVFASLVTAYPENVKAEFNAAINGRIPFLLLDKRDLELGERRIERSGFSSPLAFYDLLEEPIVNQAVKRLSPSDEQRKVEFGIGALVRGTP